MDIYKTIIQRRTIRKFKQRKIAYSLIKKMIFAAHCAPSAANLQPWKFLVVDRKELRECVFRNVRWAAYITPHGNPAEHERPLQPPRGHGPPLPRPLSVDPLSE